MEKIVNRKVLSIFAVAMFLMSMAVFAIPVSATPTEWHVYPGTGTPIQDAIDAATSGDEILVHTGTYYESVRIIGKSLSIISVDGPQLAVVDPPSGAYKSCFYVRADGVKIDGFELTGAAGYDAFGIDFQGSYNTFVNNEIHNIAPTANGGGICSWDPDGGSDYNKISNNEIYDVIGGDGILIGAVTMSGVNTGNTITDNIIHHCGTWHPGIEVVNGVGFTISGNSISGYTGLPQYYGILILSWNTIVQGSHTISSNEVEGYYTGIEIMAWTQGGVVHGLPPASPVVINNVVIMNNEVHHNVYHGIDLRPITDGYGVASVTNNVILYNDAHDNGYQGIYLRTSADSNEVHHNYAHDNGGDGIKIIGDSNSIHHNTVNTNTGIDIHLMSTADYNIVHHNVMDETVVVEAGATGNKVFRNTPPP